MDSYVYTKGLSSLEFYLALVTFDPRGVGRSGPAKTEEDFSLDIAAADAARVADALGLSQSVVIGHSGGGALALTYALRHPERVSHLVLVCTAARWTTPSPLQIDSGLPRTEAEMRTRMRSAIARAVWNPDRFMRAMDELLPKMHFSPERLRWTAEHGAARYDVRAALERVQVPTLIIHGRQDRMIPLERAEEIRRGIPASRLVVFDECGHWPHVEKRVEFVAAVKEFLGLEDRVPRSF
jgi:proline iminopeptidase